MIRIGSVGATDPEPQAEWTWPDVPAPRSSADDTLPAQPPAS